MLKTLIATETWFIFERLRMNKTGYNTNKSSGLRVNQLKSPKTSCHYFKAANNAAERIVKLN